MSAPLAFGRLASLSIFKACCCGHTPLSRCLVNLAVVGQQQNQLLAHKNRNFTSFSQPVAFSSSHVFTRGQHTASVNDEMTDDTSAELDVLYRQIDLEMKGHDPSVLNSYQKFLVMAADEFDITISKILTPQKKISRMSLLKSIHIYKKHFVQYEMRTHYKVIKLKHMTGSTADTYLEYIQRNLPEGVAMKVTRHRLDTLPPHVRKATPISNVEHS